MAFDGIVTGALVDQLKSTLVGLRVDKIYQVENDEINIKFRKYNLLISSSGNNPRIYLTEEKKDSPKQAPIFSMVLRKHLNGAVLTDVVQYGNDRVVELIFDAWDDFSEKIQKSLVVEIMGRHSNIILLDQDRVIVDAIKRVNFTMSRVREVLPHLAYVYIEDQTKLDLYRASEDEIKEKLQALQGARTLAKGIFTSFTGFSKAIGQEVAARASLDPDRPVSSLDDEEKSKVFIELLGLIKEIKTKDYKPRVYLQGGKILDFHVLELESMAGLEEKTFSNPSQMLDAVYYKRDKDDRMGQKSQALRKLVANKLSKDKSKKSKLERDLLEAENREKYKVYADVLSANFHKIQAGLSEISLDNFYSEDLEKILIPLDVKLSGPQNAQKYYKKYAKLKNAENILNKQIYETALEIQYLDSVLSQIQLADQPSDIDEIKDELIQEGYIRRNKKKYTKKKSKQAESKEYDYQGFKIYVGKNNRENDFLTHKVARRDDYWFHIQGLPGSHVIVKTEGKNLPDQVIDFAAKLAAYNSKARDSGAVEVDYTKKQNVKRHPANKPGLVNYVDFETILVSSAKPEKI
ncbi:MAG: NFACT RNA binding domain-containing protein [Bacillota bacterium]|nr:NFACT RNA binding domain-containing protein [Bacillota bacterium]